MSNYMLEYAELYIVPEPMTKNRTCQSQRWKQIAMCDELEPLKAMLEENMRIIDKDCNVICKHTKQR